MSAWHSEQVRIRDLGLLAGLLWLLAGALAVAIWQAAPTPMVDVDIATPVHAFAVSQPWVVGVCQVFAVMGSALVLTPVTVVVVIVLARTGHGWFALWVAACGMGGWIISETVKHIVDRHRPVWPDPLATLTSPSFPSGHSMAGIYGYVVFGVVALALLRQRWPGVVLIVFGVLMGPSRVALGVHWPTDVLEGWLLAGAWVCTVATILLALQRRRITAAEQVGAGALT